MLWLLVVLLAIETLVGEFYRPLLLTVLHLAILLTFVFVHGALRYGTKGIVAFAVICLVVSNIFENMGVATGFPFGPYHYTDALGPKLGYVPLMIGPAYLGVGYLSWVLATVLVGDVQARRGCVVDLCHAGDRRLHHGAVGPGHGPVGIDARPMVDLAPGRRILRRAAGELSRLVSDRVRLHADLRPVSAAHGPEQPSPQPKGYYLQAVAMYAVVALDFVAGYLVHGSSEPLIDAAGMTWRSGDIRETAALTSLLTMMFVVVLATVTHPSASRTRRASWRLRAGAGR